MNIRQSAGRAARFVRLVWFQTRLAHSHLAAHESRAGSPQYWSNAKVRNNCLLEDIQEYLISKIAGISALF